MAKLLDRAKMTVVGTPGTGSVQVGTALQAFQSFAGAGLNDGDQFSYLIQDGTNWEIGVGSYVAATTSFSRAVTKSNASPSTAPISASSSAVVTATLRAEDVGTAQYLRALLDVSVAPGPGVDGEFLFWNNTATAFELKQIPFTMATFSQGTLAAGETLAALLMPFAATLQAGAAGCLAKAATAATAAAAISVTRNGTQVGTITWSAGGATGVVAVASDVSLAQGDTLALVAPSPADSTLAGVSVTLNGLRNS